MENEYNFDTLLMTGVLRALKEQGLITEEELNECIVKLEREENICYG